MAFMTTIEKSQHTRQENQVTSKWKNIKQNVETCILYSSLPEIACKTVRPLTPEFRGKNGNFQNSHSRLENRDQMQRNSPNVPDCKGIPQMFLTAKEFSFSSRSLRMKITYLIFVIFFTQAKFLENKIYTEKTPIFRVKSVKNATFSHKIC